MINYHFEYTNSNYLNRLMGVSFLVFGVLVIAMAVTVDIIGMFGGMALAFGVPVLIFLLNKKKIKKLGAATIYDTYSEFHLSDINEKFYYSEIQSYQVEWYNSASLNINLNDGKKIKIVANTNFCKSDQLELFCHEFDKTVQQYKKENNIELERKKSLFEKAWMLPFLVFISAILVGGLAFALIKGISISAVVYSSIVMIGTMWIAYFKTIKKRKEMEN